MEGLMPVLMCRGGASSVLATDAMDHCVEKMNAVKHYFNVNFDYTSVGLMYSLYKKLANESFDLINCSGLLYHVFSPLMVLSGVRPLLKRDGLMIISTNVTLAKGFSMEFNNEGRIQQEENTFWYISIELLDYMMRYLKLAPIDCIYFLHSNIKSNVRLVFDKPSGYVSVLCRATDNVLSTEEDQWMHKSAKSSWEYRFLSNWELAKHQPKSSIQCKNQIDKQYYRKDIECLDLWKAINQTSPATVNKESDSHKLRLSDNS
jgi:SAM-dependent methyltransferase